MRKIKTAEFLFFAILFTFSWFLMWKTFRLSNSGNMEIATKVWSDFGATIPLIRSFSFGSNFPPEYPIFAGAPIRYHFVFFALVGAVEKMGISIDWALNSLSILSFFFLLLAIYYLSFEIFRKRSVSVISCLLFLFNGSFSFLEFFKKYPLSGQTVTDIIHNSEFLSFGPYYGDKIISAFWSLNIYTNQRHLAFAYASFLTLILIIYKAGKKPEGFSLAKSLLIAIAMGLFPFIHLPVFMMMEGALCVFFVVYPNLRRKIFNIILISLLLALPQIVYLGPSATQVEIFHPGYLIENLTYENFIKYWFLNLGLASIFTPIGFLLASRQQRKVFLPFLAFFIIGNIFQFSPEIAANHKFFNIFIIGANIFTAYSIFVIWKWNDLSKIIISACFAALILSGIIDFFPIKNDVYMEIADYPKDNRVRWIVNNTPKEAVFLNSSFTYHPASIAGRKIYLGWPYFIWSAGYDISHHSKIMENIYESHDVNEICTLSEENNIDYITVESTEGDINLPTIDLNFFRDNFRLAYEDQEQNYYIIDIDSNCSEFDR